jgi:hypothetical protein
MYSEYCIQGFSCFLTQEHTQVYSSDNRDPKLEFFLIDKAAIHSLIDVHWESSVDGRQGVWGNLKLEFCWDRAVLFYEVNIRVCLLFYASMIVTTVVTDACCCCCYSFFKISINKANPWTIRPPLSTAAWVFTCMCHSCQLLSLLIWISERNYLNRTGNLWFNCFAPCCILGFSWAGEGAPFGSGVPSWGLEEACRKQKEMWVALTKNSAR